MKTKLVFEYREFEKCKELSFYNHIVYKVTTPNMLGVNRIVEKYDDVDEFPTYYLESNERNMEIGRGDPIDEDKIGFGGKFLEIELL